MSDELEEELRYQQLRKLSRDVVPPATDEELAVIDRLFAARGRGVNGITWALEVYRAGRASRDAEVEELRAVEQTEVSALRVAAQRVLDDAERTDDGPGGGLYLVDGEYVDALRVEMAARWGATVKSVALPPCPAGCGARQVQIACRACGRDRTEALATLWGWRRPAAQRSPAEVREGLDRAAQSLDRVWRDGAS